MTADRTVSSVLIVGGATGIGLAALRAFRSRGDSVLLADINFAEAQRVAAEDLPGRVVPYLCDAGSANGPRAAVEAAVEAFGHLDVVFANAAVAPSAPIEEFSVEEWDRCLAVNLRAPFLLAQAATPYLEASTLARIIITSSTAAFRGVPGQPAYAASKGGIVSLVRALAAELSPRGIRVNCICPGWVDTPFNDAYWNSVGDRETAVEKILERVPISYLAQAEDITGVVLFLSEPQSAYINGQSIVIDGGYLAV